MIGLQAAVRSTSLALTSELAPSPDPAALIARARRLSDFVDAIHITESPGLRPLGSPLLTALLLRQAGMEPVLHMNCRNRNRVALQGELLGAATAGISALLLRRNIPMRVGRVARKHAVFDIGARELIATARRIRDADPPSRYGLAQAPDFFIGAAATVFDATATWQPKSLLAKLDSGVQWVQTQLCMDLPLLRSYMRRFVAARLTHRAHPRGHHRSVAVGRVGAEAPHKRARSTDPRGDCDCGSSRRVIRSRPACRSAPRCCMSWQRCQVSPVRTSSRPGILNWYAR